MLTHSCTIAVHRSFTLKSVRGLGRSNDKEKLICLTSDTSKRSEQMS